MRICLVTHCFPHTDHDVNGNWIPQFSNLLIERGHHVSVVTPRMEVGDGIVPKSNWPFDVQFFAWKGGAKRLGQLRLSHPADTTALISLLRQGRIVLEKIIDERRIDLCVGIWAIPNGYFCLRAKQKKGTPYAVWTLGSDVNIYGKKILFRKTVTHVLRKAEYIFANSNHLMKRIEELTGRMCEFMPTNRILPPKEESDLALDTSSANFLYVGRLEHVKGVDVLVEAMIELLRNGHNASLYVLGDGSMRSDLEKRISHEGIGQHVVFVAT